MGGMFLFNLSEEEKFKKPDKRKIKVNFHAGLP